MGSSVNAILNDGALLWPVAHSSSRSSDAKGDAGKLLLSFTGEMIGQIYSLSYNSSGVYTF